MPRSRNSRSASPQKSVSAESIEEFEHRKTLQNVHDIFCEAIDSDVIRFVLQECNWREEEAVDKLLMIAESHEEQRKYKSKLHRIAEGVFGSLRSEDYGHTSAVTAASSLSPSEKVIRRPSKPPAASADKGSADTSNLHHVGSSEHLLARGLAPTFYLSGAQSSSNSAVDEIEMDLHFPQLPTKASETNLSSASSSVSSQKSQHTEQAKAPSSSKTVLLSQAQSAFNQQFDDAEGTQRWEQYKQKLSEHYLVNLTKDKPGGTSKGQSPVLDSKLSQSFPDDPAILQAELESPKSDKVVQKEVERPRSETSRNFPVRLLSRSPDTVEDDVPVLISGQNAATRVEINEIMSSGNLDSADLDETVLKCIYEVHGDLLDEEELERGSLSQNAEGKKSSTPTSLGQTVVSSASKPATQLSNEAMTLPTIGLSVDAVEFVPRPKPAVTTSSTTATSQKVKDTSPQPASKMTKSSSIEIKSGVRNAQINSTSISIGSPLTVSPSLSPGLSPPTPLMNSPVANLTGSPMFITPKWPPVFHTINHPPPMPPTVLASTTSRFVSPNPAHHLSPPGYRFPQAGPLPYSSRMVYTVAPPPMFRMAGVPRYVQQPSMQVGENIEDRAAIATGQPIMATSEASRLISPPTGLTTVKLFNPTYIEQKAERIQTLQKSGVKVLIIVRGLPRSGKSTLARALQLNGIVLSTDDYFMKGNLYDYNPEKLTEAHQWNRERSKEAMKMGKSPVIIDNTNTQTWEFKPYVSMALTYNYHIELVEPNTPWKYKASELARRTLHGVPKDQIERMCNRYEHNITVEALVRKRKADTKANDIDVTEGINDIATKSDENLASSPDEVSTTVSRITDTRGTKDLRLHNFSKAEDFRKQRSAESDSDSISSYHSGSLSNQSSRNASPKPLRPSLKTPVALQKMEKLKPPVTMKPVAIKTTVKRVKKKEIKQMEAKLSSETVQVVNEMVNEHVGDRILSVDDATKLEEELKALLMLYPMNDSEVSSAEELIGLKLHDIINQTAEIPEADDDVEEENSDRENTENVSNNDIKFELPGNAEVSNNENDNKLGKELKSSSNIEIIESDKQNGEIFDDKDIENAIENDLLKHGLHNEGEAMQSNLKVDTNTTERGFPSWTEIANVKKEKHSNEYSNEEKSNSNENFGYIGSERLQKYESDRSAEGDISIAPNDFESQYWGNIVTESNKVTHWDNNEYTDWGDTVSSSNQFSETNSENNKTGAKPQRKKRNKSADALPDESYTPSNEIIKNTDEVIEEFDNDIFVDCNEEMDEVELCNNSQFLDADKDKELDGNCEGVKIDKAGNEETGAEIQIPSGNTEVRNEMNMGSAEKVEDLDAAFDTTQDNDIEETVCSRNDIDRSQDSIHETSHLNSSLQMLKESYIDAESAILTEEKDHEDIIGLEDTKESDVVRAIYSNGIESGELDNGTATEMKSIEDLTLVSEEKGNKIEYKSSEMLTVSDDADSENLKVVQSSESLTPSEDSEVDVAVRSESDIEVTPQTSQKSLTPSSAQRNKKPSRRKMAANLMGPFLNSEDKEKFKTSSWNSFPIHSVEKPMSSPTHSKVSNGKDVVNAMTMTDNEFFSLVFRLNQGDFVDSSIRYLKGNPRKLVNGLNTNVELNSLNEVHTLEKSTSTDDFVTMTDTESVEFLQTCFPSVPIGELECVLENCANNVEWAINLLLDWKYSLNLSEEEKKQFTEGMAEVKKGASQTTSEPCPSDSVRGPGRLLDICFNLVEKEKIASREEIEKQLIQTGKDRLDRIEDDNITKIRLRRSTSLNESSFDIGSFSPNKNDLSVFRSFSSPAQITDSVIKSIQDLDLDNSSDKGSIHENAVICDVNDKVDSESDLRTVKHADKNSELVTVNEVEKEKSGENDVDGADVMVNHVDADVFDFDLKPALSMNVDTEVIGKLEDMFGPLGNRNDVKDNLPVPLDRKTAWLMYQCIKKGMISMRSQQRREQQQLIKDEELARQLQEEENAYIKPGIRNQREENVSGSRGRKSTPLVGLSVLGTIPQHKEPVAWNRGNQSLAEIMQEEQRIQESQQEFLRLIEKEGGQTAMATCLKRQKLYGKFPKLDKKLLDEIFQANCFNLTETIASIETSLAEGHTGTATVTMVTDDALSDQKLLEATKKQSMQEMLDSYIYHPVASKDYQDGAEPEYEDYRGEASLHFRLRHECFQKAREAHSRGLKQVATFYSQQGHQHTQKIKEANMRASEQILAERNHDIEKNMTLDLHGLHVDEAVAALNRIIPQKEKDRCKKLIIITGRGSHSRGGVAKLRPSIISYLNSNKYSFTELQTGVFNVSLKYRTPDR